MLLLAFSTIIGCLPKMWQKQCIEQEDCSNFNLIASEPPSEKPFEISRNDTDLQVRVHNFHLEESKLKAYSEGLEMCRGLHLSRDTYQLQKERLLQRVYPDYKFTKENLIDGEYLPCGEWKPTTYKTKLSVVLPGADTPVQVPLTSDKDEHDIPFYLLGISMLLHPEDPKLSYEATTNERVYAFDEILPEQQEEWICSALSLLQNIEAKGSINDWNLIFETPHGSAVVPYNHDNTSRLWMYRDAIKQCGSSLESHLVGVIAKSSAAYPSGYREFLGLNKVLFGKKLTSKRRSNGTTSTSGPVQRTENKAMAGTYRCAVAEQIAYLRIYRDGTFKLKVELQNGSASGTCSGSRCEIDSIYKSAIAFTGGVDSFSLQRRAKAVILNNKTRCELR